MFHNNGRFFATLGKNLRKKSEDGKLKLNLDRDLPTALVLTSI